MSPASDRFPIIVIGASAGGVEALTQLARALPDGLPAPVAVVLHVPPLGRSVLPAILSRAGKLPASAAAHGEKLEAGQIYVAPPDQHMLVDDGRVVLRHGPRENGHRPAIDALFLSAAHAYGPAVIGVILTGTLDDGAAGLAAIKSHGGVAVVQDPTDALYPGMPASALERVVADHVVGLEHIPDLLVDIVGNPTPLAPVSESERIPAEAPRELAAGPGMAAGDAVGLSCPECGGALWYIEEGGAPRYRCRIGHAYSEQSLFEEHGRSLEVALWTALRALEERAGLLRRMSARARDAGHAKSAQRFDGHAADLDSRAAVIREHIVPKAVESDQEVASG